MPALGVLGSGLPRGLMPVGPGCGTVWCPALGAWQRRAGRSWAPGRRGSTGGFGEEQHKCSHRLNALTVFQGTDSAALNLIPV